jgi:hypothetical protein
MKATLEELKEYREKLADSIEDVVVEEPHNTEYYEYLQGVLKKVDDRIEEYVYEENLEDYKPSITDILGNG